LTRHILVLLVQYQMPSKEISRRFGISRRTVRRHLRKAIRRIATRQERRVP
jgi:RNA polymerase sigma factor (sigma-70 family)